MSLPSDSDSALSSNPRGIGADFSDAEEARDIYFPLTSQSRQARDDWTVDYAQRKQQAEEKLKKVLLDSAPEPDSANSPNISQSKLVNVALEGMVPVMMRERGGGSGAGDSSTERPTMQTECPLPPSRTVTTTTDPVVKVSWGPDNHIFASGEAVKIFTRFRKREKQNIKAELKKDKVEEESVMEEEIRAQPSQKASKDLLMGEMIEVMKIDKVWSLADIATRVKRPEADILEVFGKIAFKRQEEDRGGKWELRPEFKKPNFKLQNMNTGTGTYQGRQGALTDTSEHELDAEGDAPLFMAQKQSPMPPPGTPYPELDASSQQVDKDQLKHSLSTPTLPTFHSISDAALVATYRAERAKDPAAFDKKTAGIKRSLTAAKIHRGGGSFLTQGDYTVELASREDAAAVEKWKHDENSLKEIDEGGMGEERNGDDRKTYKFRERKRAQRKSKESQAGRDADPTVPANFDLAENVCRYTTSGSLRQQCTRQVEEDEAGKKITYTTWIEIKQEIVVPTNKDLSWVDVREATRQAKGRKNGEDRDAGNGKSHRKKKSKDADASVVDKSSSSSSEDHNTTCPKRRSQKEQRRVKTETEKVAESKGGAVDAARELNSHPIDAARMVGELVTAIDELRDGKAKPEAGFLEAISKQMLEVAKFVNEVTELGTN